MSYPCPFLGTENEVKQCKRPADTLRGFKKHLTHNHGGWTTDQIQAVTEANPETPVATIESPELSMADSTTQAQPAVERERTTPTEVEKSSKKRKAFVRLSKAMSGTMDFIASIIPPITVAFFKNKLGIEGTLTEEGAAHISELWSAFFDFLGVEVENIEPINIKVSGRKALFLVPLSIMGTTLMVMKNVHRVPVENKGKKEEKKPESPAEMPNATPEQ